MTDKLNYYADLDIPRNASPEDIRRAYHKAARQLHPDVNVGDGATELFLRIQTAYETLIDPDQRAEYDKSLPPVEKEPPSVNLTRVYSRPSLTHTDEAQLVYVLMELVAPTGAKMRPSPPLNVCLVLDRSTSMQGERMDIVKKTAIELIRQLRPPDVFSIVTFSDRAEVLIPASNRPEAGIIESKIQMIQPGGGTEIFRGLEAGFFEVRSKYSSANTNHIILLTDGRTYGDEAACLRIADQAAIYGIGISGLGIGEEWNDGFLDSLASRTGGSSMYLSKPGDIKRFLKEKVNNLGQVYAERVTLDLKMRPGVELCYAMRLSPDVHPLPKTSPLRMGVIPKDLGLGFLLEFKVGPLGPDVQSVPLADGQLTFDVPALPRPGCVLEVQLVRPVTDARDFPPPSVKLVQAVSRLTLYRMQESAQDSLQEGETQDASRYLQNLATHLFAHGKHDLARTTLQEVNNIERHLGVSEAGKKQIKYGTRALLLPARVPDNAAQQPQAGWPA